MTTETPKIQAIFPLNVLQQGLLFHHLMQRKSRDQGFLTVQCDLKGLLDVDALQQAWRHTTLRHEVLRASVHWKNLEKPVILIRPEKEINWTLLDWSSIPAQEQELKFENYKLERASHGSILDDAPLSNITLIQRDERAYYLLWECHHLLLDGWSSTIILRDAFAYYEGLCAKKEFTLLEEIPTFKSYTNYLKSISKEDATRFWSDVFADFQGATLFEKRTKQEETQIPIKYEYKFENQDSQDLKMLARKYKVTLNTLFQGIWAMTLARYFDIKDVAFGNTVSGRSISFSGIERMAGMFANVLPVRTILNESLSFEKWLQLIQQQQQGARDYEYCKIDEIASLANLAEDKTLFDTLFVFENFPWEDIQSDKVTVKNFKSGITTTYPITAIFKIESDISYELLVDPSYIPEELANWFLNAIPIICNTLLSKKEVTIVDLLNSYTNVPEAQLNNSLTKNKESQNAVTKVNTDYVAARNQTELILIKIWEQLFGVKYLSVVDNFFDLGGKSLLSVKMCALIEEKLNVKIPPTALLEFPTIEALALLIKNKRDVPENIWTYLVPIKTKGGKAPLFCIHAGGGHVFFYKGLADAVDVERPVYALQPVGIFGKNQKHQSIEVMAQDYANEINEVQPEGVLNIMVYCFSTAVGIEMASYLKSKGRETHLIVADTIADHRLLLSKERLFIRVTAFLRRFFSNPFKALQMMIGYRIMFYVKPLKIKLFGNEAEKNTEEMRLHLVALFNTYKWGTQIDNISLVLTEKGDKRYNEEIVRSWKPLVNREIQVEVSEGSHTTFFEAPDVLHTAKAMEKVIVEN